MAWHSHHLYIPNQSGTFNVLNYINMDTKSNTKIGPNGVRGYKSRHVDLYKSMHVA